MRCTNIIKAGQSLLTLISDLKECLIFKDFPAINQNLTNQKVSRWTNLKPGFIFKWFELLTNVLKFAS